MRLHIYRGLDKERIPDDVTHVIVDGSVTTIKKEAFQRCRDLVSVIMDDNVKVICWHAFEFCTALRFVRFSKTLEFIAPFAFRHCDSLEALFLPSTVKGINVEAFKACRSLRLLILPNDIDLSNVAHGIIGHTAIYRTAAAAAGVQYNVGLIYDAECSRQVHEWLYHHMDDSPFHKLCYSSSITTRRINNYLNENGNDSTLQIDAIHGMTPLHMLSMNPYAPADTISALLDSNMEAVFCLDNEVKTPLDYARDCNVGGLVGMITGLCNHRNSSILVESNTHIVSASKRRKIIS